MNNNEKHLEKEKKCKRCGSALYADNSIEVGYCMECANINKDARRAWEDKGLAKFCSSCGQMLYAQNSIEKGKCTPCRSLER
jgi:DNA-directed RNA polymerase subunit M/transcription elongation factor TFIIS